jgi:fructosamine-3-kinase
VLVRRGRIAGFVDPAIYCGHPEIELAFTMMFGTFGRTFFEACEALMPLEPGFHELRSDLYNLYPNLVHVRLALIGNKKNRPGQRRAGLPCETSRSPKAWP